jgi:hypothetical protein
VTDGRKIHHGEHGEVFYFRGEAAALYLGDLASWWFKSYSNRQGAKGKLRLRRELSTSMPSVRFVVNLDYLALTARRCGDLA